MKIKFHYIIILAGMLAGSSCNKLDNVKPPSITLKGQLMYKGTPIGVEYNQVPFALYQTGFAVSSPITGTFDQDGNYSVLTFKGNYKFTIPGGQGPFQWKELASGGRDTVAIALTGDQTVNIEVTPYYMVRNTVITASGSNILAKFGLEKIITDATGKDIQSVTLYVNKTQFVDHINNAGKASIDGSAITDMANISLSVPKPTFAISQNYVYARIEVAIAGVDDKLFSPTIKVTF